MRTKHGVSANRSVCMVDGRLETLEPHVLVFCPKAAASRSKSSRRNPTKRFCAFGMFFALLAGLSLIAPDICRAQLSTAGLSGVVRDASGAVVPGATVVLRNIDNGFERKTATNETGDYVLLNLVPGRYSIEVSKEGFGTEAETGIPIVVGESTTHDFILNPGQSRQTVTVEANVATLNTATSGLGTALMQSQVENLPLNGRNYTELLLLTPGASPINLTQSGGGWEERPIGDFAFPAFHGQDNKSTLFVIDSVMATGSFYGGYTFAPNPDEIEELKVQSHTDQAEFGQVLGGTVDVVTKGGTNVFHGAAWEYLRNSALDSRNFFIPTITPLRQNQFGFNVGGPVLLPHYNGRNKTFFYGSLEEFRLNTANQVLYQVPTLANLQGDFSNRPQPLYNPYTTAPDPNNPGAYTRAAFVNNFIPAQYMDPKAVALAQKVWPAPVSTGFPNFNGIDTSPSMQHQYQYTFRVDQQFGTKDSIWFRFTKVDQNSIVSEGTAIDKMTEHPFGHNFGLNYIHTFGPSWVLHGLLGRNSFYQDTVSKIAGLDDSTFLPTVFNPSFACGYKSFGNGPQGCNMPPTNGLSFGSTNESTTANAVGDDWQIAFDVAHVMGKHTIKWGGGWLSNYANNGGGGPDLLYSSAQTANPENAGVTGDSDASFFLGLPSYASKGLSTYQLNKVWVHGYWVQDTWKIKDKLTLNIGLRWDINFQGYLTSNGKIQSTGNMDFITGNYIMQNNPGSCASLGTAPCIPNGTLPDHVVVSTNKNGAIWDNDYKDFGPHLGIAYAVNNKTAIRTSYERVYDPWTNINQDEENIQGQWPSVASISAGNLNAVNVDTHFEDPVGNSALPAATPFAQQGWSVDPHMKTPYSDQWNFGVQREINPTTTLTASYVGSHDGRAPLGFVADLAQTPGPGNPALRSPFPYAVPGFFTAGWGRSSYNGFEFTLDKRFSHGLTYLVSYTWSKTIDIGSDQGGFLESYGIQNPYDFNADKSVAGYDLPHVFRFSWVWDFPWRSQNRPLDAAIHGWHVNGIASLTSGQPFSVGISGDNANIGNSLYPAQRPDLVGNPKLSSPTVLDWFNTAAFGAPAPYTFGNEGRNILRADWFKNLDLGIFRDFYMTETKRLQFRFESFNLTNTPTFGVPNATYGSPTEGQVSGTLSTSREIQFALKFLF